MVGGGGCSYNVVAPPAARWNKKVAVAENDICPLTKGESFTTDLEPTFTRDVECPCKGRLGSTINIPVNMSSCLVPSSEKEHGPALVN